jgi:hypothetical protein
MRGVGRVFSRARVDRGVSVLTRVWATDKSLPPTPMTAAIYATTRCRAVKNVTPWTIFGILGPGGSRTGSVVDVAMSPPAFLAVPQDTRARHCPADVCAFWVIRCIGPRKNLKRGLAGCLRLRCAGRRCPCPQCRARHA